MKRSRLQIGLYLAAAFALVIGSSSATAQQGQERIVSARVVSDQVVSPAPDNYVGDMSMVASGCSSCGNSGGCMDGNCNGGCMNGSCGDDCGKCKKGCQFCGKATGGCLPRSYGQPDLFYNFYSQGNCNRANAQMYMSPLPTPPNVGQTFFTYQPFYPHELLYHHKDRFHNYYDQGRGINRTRAVYYSPPVRQAISNIYWNYLRLPR